MRAIKTIKHATVRMESVQNQQFKDSREKGPNQEQHIPSIRSTASTSDLIRSKLGFEVPTRTPTRSSNQPPPKLTEPPRTHTNVRRSQRDRNNPGNPPGSEREAAKGNKEGIEKAKTKKRQKNLQESRVNGVPNTGNGVDDNGSKLRQNGMAMQKGKISAQEEGGGTA